jgi:hypothetical protein
VDAFFASQPDEARRGEVVVLDALYRRVTGLEPVMWGPAIVGYGSYHYQYATGREGVMCRAGFSPRKAALTVYLMSDYGDRAAEADDLFTRLGKHSTSKSCLYIKRLDQVDMVVLEGLIALSWARMNLVYPE